MTKEEDYYKYLEKLIAEKKKDSKSPLEALEIRELLKEIRKRNPEVLNLFNPKYQRFLKQEGGEPLLKHLKTLPKGSVVFGKDKHGNVILFLNKGRKSKNRDVEVEMIDPKILKKSNKEIKEYLFEKVFAEDVKTIESKISGRDPFEKEFKKMVKEQGQSCDPKKTIQNLYKTLSDDNKEDFLFSFQDMGKDSFFNMLNTWKEEALVGPKKEISKKQITYTHTHTKKIKSKEHNVGHSR